jgi:hypothetical protein
LVVDQPYIHRSFVNFGSSFRLSAPEHEQEESIGKTSKMRKHGKDDDAYDAFAIRGGPGQKGKNHRSSSYHKQQHQFFTYRSIFYSNGCI